jgi:hypothetical protein
MDNTFIESATRYGYHLEKIDESNLPIVLVESLNILKTVVSEVYDFDNWNINVAKIDDTYYAVVVIKYDKLTVTNTEYSNETIQIEDLFVAYNFSFTDSYEPRLLDIKGTRGKLTDIEYKNNYLHSHLSTSSVRKNDNIIRLNNFCLGSGGVEMIKSILESSFTTVNFKLLLYQMNEFVLWESEEGGPYIHIRNLSNTGSRYRAERYTSALTVRAQEIFDNIINHELTTEDFDIVVNESVVKVKVNSSSIAQKVEPTFCYTINDGKQYNATNFSKIEKSMKNDLIWNGQYLVTELVSNESDNIEIQRFLKHKYLNYIQEKLEYFIFYNQFTNPVT